MTDITDTLQNNQVYSSVILSLLKNFTAEIVNKISRIHEI